MKKLYGLIFILIVIYIGSSCKREELNSNIVKDNDGVIVGLPYKWVRPLSENGYIVMGLQTSVTLDKNVLLTGMENDDQVFYMIKSENGEMLWKWNDFITDFEDWNIVSNYQYESYLIVPNGPRGYCIDLSTGQTVWSHYGETDLGSILIGLGTNYFRLGNYVINDDGYYEGVAFSGNALSGELPRIVVIPPYKREKADNLGSVGLLPGIAPFVDTDTFLILAYTDPVSGTEYSNYLGLYNVSKEEWMYSGKEITTNTLFGAGTLTILNDKVYLQSSKKLFCFEIKTGKKIWEKSFSQGFSSIIVVDNKVIANNEDRVLYALDPLSGKEVWREPSSGTSSPLVHMNGVLYFVGGGDGLLHAVDVETGKHLWRISSPDLKTDRGAWFKRHVALVPGSGAGDKGKVVVSSYLRAFCYDAAR